MKTKSKTQTQPSAPRDWSRFTQLLLNWFSKYKRDLPWRKTCDPYAIWVSETMLQQTQVATVLPYYFNFLQKFPTMQSLANASLDEVLKIWQGLGYYSRARSLHSTAREVVAKYGGELPKKREELLSLCGIGPYTASAIASIAYGEPSPVVDGNVWRVFSRILALESSPDQGKKTIFDFLTKIIPPSSPSFFNQALMELGSLVCTPQNPRCLVCPVSSFCRAWKEGKVNKLPRKNVQKKLPHRHWIAVVARCNSKTALRQRPLRGVWGGLWEFPSASVIEKNSPFEIAKGFADKLKLRSPKVFHLEPIHHRFSHFKLTLHPFLFELPKTKNHASLVWTSIHENEYPMPVPHLKILKQLLLESGS